MSFSAYLRHQKKYTPMTAEVYQRRARQFQKWMKKNSLSTDQITYNIMMDYIDHCRSKGNEHPTIINKIMAIKRWFEYRYIIPNPCEHIELKRRPHHLPSPLLTTDQISELYHLLPIGTHGQIRDKAVLGFLCYQALTGYDIKRLEIGDIDRDRGFIHVRKGKKVEARSLRIQTEQQKILNLYIDESRGLLLKDRQSELFCIKGGMTQKPEDLYNYLWRLVRRIKEMYPAFNNIPQLRSSIICNWLKKENLREVQYKAGHKHISSTERFKQANVEDLQKALDEMHPLR